MEIKIIDDEFTVCKVKDYSEIDLDDKFCFIGKTDEELSLVCSTNKTPKNTIEREDDWRAFRIQGILDFSIIGVLSRLSTLLADNNISIFGVSTFNTDYILVKKNDFEKAIKILKKNDINIVK